jgi:integrase
VEFQQLPKVIRESWDRFVAAHAATASPAQSSLANLVPDEEEVFSLEPVEAPSTETRFSPQQLSTIRTWVTYAANVMIANAEEIHDLSDLVRPDVVRVVLQNVGRRQQERAKVQDRTFHRVNATLLNGATTFVTLARIFLIGAPVVEELIELRDRVDPRLREKRRQPNGTIKRIYHHVQIGPRHAERLAQFRDPAKLAAWFETPDRLWERMQAVTRRGVPPSPEEINDAIVCVLYQVTVGGCPIRRANLASLRIVGPKRNLLLPERKGQCGQIRIEWWETKNKKELLVELTPHAAEVIHHFIQCFRPKLMINVGSAPDNPYLFPAGGQGHRDGTLLNAAFVDRNRKIGGFLLNVHVQRHLTAFIILKQDPNGMDVVQKILGHRKRETTMRYYAQVDDIVAQQKYHELLELARLHTKRLPLLQRRW